MNETLIDHAARERFRTEWDSNFAVSANAGSGKTTAISERLAAIAVAPGARDRLCKTAVVTYTKKAAAQIGQRARQILLRRLAESGARDLAPLDNLECAFFGTIHSFCLKLAQTCGQTVGINLNPTVIAEDDEAPWEEFIEQDSMRFDALGAAELAAFLRHVALDEIFPLARELDAATAATLRTRRPAGSLPAPAAAAGEQLLALGAKGAGAKNILLSQERARKWRDEWEQGAGFLPLYEPVGTAQAVVACAREWMAPLKRWLADAAAALAGELAERYRAWRFDRGVQTYSDQIDAAMAVLRDEASLDRMRAEGWRIILDEAQDTDRQQFAVLVELARPPGARRGSWPSGSTSISDGSTGAAQRADHQDRMGPRPGHFCMVGDGQQSIYSGRTDIGNFLRHLDAFRTGDGGEMLEFQVTFRAPHAVIGLLNATLPAAFGPGGPHNFGPPPNAGAPPPFLQVPYVPLEPGPENVAGEVRRLPLVASVPPPAGVNAWLADEAGQLAAWLRTHGPEGVGARAWGDVAVLAPRNEWLLTARKAFESAGLEVALQTRRSRSGDNPAYAWLAGLLAVVVDPDDMFEWVGVLREIFGVSDGLIAAEMRARGRLVWEDPAVHPEPLAGALATVRVFVLRANDSGQALHTFARELADACALGDKAWSLDPSGGITAELERVLAEAAELGLEGGSPRAWLERLLHGINEGRPMGKPNADAINLLTSHSAKGLEWPVVITLGLWRGIRQAPDRGMKLVRNTIAGPQVFFDGASLPADTREARERERVRELTRLLYVTLTRARRVIVVPWADGFGVPGREPLSFAGLWAAELSCLPDIVSLPPVAPVMAAEASEAVAGEIEPEPALRALPALPARLLPHQLGRKTDVARMARHESGLDAPLPARSSDDAIDYGVWWHETMEFLPWSGDDAAVAAHGERALAAAEGLGFRARAKREWERFRASDAWIELRAARWTRLAELGILAPLRDDAWIDGVIDLVLHDGLANELWIVDWKTNRRLDRESDDALLGRLVGEYGPQLAAYARCAGEFFPGAVVKALVFSSAAGRWREVGLA